MSRFDATLQPQYAIDESSAGLLRSVFGWMTLGLALTGVVSMYVVNTPAITQSLVNSGTLMVLFLVELGLVFWLSARVMHMSAGKATTIFLAYAALNGVTLAPIALVYTGASIASAFVIASAMSGSRALYGYVTKRDLSGFGSFLMMGLVGLIIAGLVNMFLQSPGLSFAFSVIGVLIFTGLTAYDVQRIKHMGAQMSYSGSDDHRRASILGALSLYLNFINLFIMLLRFVGNSRD